MRELTDHIVTGDSANHQLTIKVTDTPGQGGANHSYIIEGFDVIDNPSNNKEEGDISGPCRLNILFQNGPIKEFGVNGITQEALLAVVIDRLRAFQIGPYACQDNQIALDACVRALYQLQNRTRIRIARGVEGTHVK